MTDSVGKAKSLELIAAPAIEKRILVVRERQVMLDEDLADLYGVETKRLIEQVKRNIERFPEDFMFQLNKSEAAALRSQIATSKIGRGGRRYAPVCLHRARSGDALGGPAEQEGHRGEHRDHAGLRRTAPRRVLLRGDREAARRARARDQRKAGTARQAAAPDLRCPSASDLPTPTTKAPRRVRAARRRGVGQSTAAGLAGSRAAFRGGCRTHPRRPRWSLSKGGFRKAATRLPVHHAQPGVRSLTGSKARRSDRGAAFVGRLCATASAQSGSCSMSHCAVS